MTRKVFFGFLHCILDLVNVNLFGSFVLKETSICILILKLRYSKFEALNFLFDLRYDYSQIKHLYIKNIIMKKFIYFFR